MSAERILVIDDEPNVIRFCQRALEKEGFAVKGALSGEEGLQLLKERGFDLTLLDVKLPGRDGLDVLSTIQEIAPEMAMIVITGHGTMEVAIRVLKSGAQDFLPKPFTPEELVTSVQKVLEKKRLIQENLRLKARLPILEISKALMSEVNLERLAQLTLETVRHALGADRVSLMLLDEERQELSISAALGLSDQVVTTTRVKVGQGLAGLAAQMRKPILVPDQVENDPAIQASLTQNDTGSAICVPLMLKDRILGVLNASRPLGGAPFRQDDVDLLSILGGQIAVAIENARLFEQAQLEIAERKQAEEALRASEKKYRQLIETLHEGIWVIDKDAYTTFVNPRMAEMLGYTVDEMQGKHLFSLIDERRVEIAKRNLERREQGIKEQHDFEFLRKDGIRIYALLETSPITDDDGNYIGAIAGVQDITERKRAEEALRNSWDYLDRILSGMYEGVMVISHDYKILDINKRFLEQYDTTREEIIGQTCHDVTHRSSEPCHEPGHSCPLKSVFETSLPIRLEHLHKDHEGKDLVVELYAFPLLGPTGEVESVVEISHDITERKRAEEELKESHERFLTVLDSLDATVCVADMETYEILFVNKYARDTFGDDLVGKICWQALQAGQSGPCDFCTNEKLLTADGKPTGVYAWECQNTITGLWYEIRDRAVRWVDGRIVRLEIAVDITERKRAEEEIRRRNEELTALNAIATTLGQSLDLNHILNATLDKVLEVIDIDAGWIQLLDEDAGVLSLVAQHGFSQEMAEETQTIKLGDSMTGQVAQSGQPIVVDKVSEDSRLSMETGRREDLHAFAGVPIKSKDKVLGVLGVFSRSPRQLCSQEVQLLTAIGHQIGVAIENVRLAEKASEIEILQELNRLRSELIANVSHELRTPLGLIKIFCSSLLMDDVDFDRETRWKFLRHTEEEVEKLEKIVDNLLDLSRMENDRLHLDKRPTDVGQLAKEVIEAIKLEMDVPTLHPPFSILYDFPPDPLGATVDVRRIEQVLRNLLSNAIKYSPEGGTITVQGRGDKRQLLIRVSDQGMGIPSEDLERVFERFYRVENGITQSARGAGLGLSVCRGIVEAHGGRIWVESTLGVGSTFYFTLPVLSLS